MRWRWPLVDPCPRAAYEASAADYSALARASRSAYSPRGLHVVAPVAVFQCVVHASVALLLLLLMCIRFVATGTAAGFRLGVSAVALLQTLIQMYSHRALPVAGKRADTYSHARHGLLT